MFKLKYPLLVYEDWRKQRRRSTAMACYTKSNSDIEPLVSFGFFFLRKGKKGKEEFSLNFCFACCFLFHCFFFSFVLNQSCSWLRRRTWNCRFNQQQSGKNLLWKNRRDLENCFFLLLLLLICTIRWRCRTNHYCNGLFIVKQ